MTHGTAASTVHTKMRAKLSLRARSSPSAASAHVARKTIIAAYEPANNTPVVVNACGIPTAMSRLSSMITIRATRTWITSGSNQLAIHVT